MNRAPILAPDAAAGASGWTEERVELLTKLWREGIPCSQIAIQLRGVSRNAVIGKVSRLGLSGRQTPSRPAKTVRVAPPPKAPRALRLPPPPPRVAIPIRDGAEAPGTCTILSVGALMCRWPIGDPAMPGFTLCGRDADGTYCDEHCKVAHQPRTTKKAHTANELMRSVRRYL